MTLLFPANEPGGLRVMNKPFCIPEIEVTTNSFPDTRVAVNMPLAEMPVPLNEKSNVSANILWVPTSNTKTTATAAKIRDPRRIQNPPSAGSTWNDSERTRAYSKLIGNLIAKVKLVGNKGFRWQFFATVYYRLTIHLQDSARCSPKACTCG